MQRNSCVEKINIRTWKRPYSIWRIGVAQLEYLRQCHNKTQVFFLTCLPHVSCCNHSLQEPCSHRLGAERSKHYFIKVCRNYTSLLVKILKILIISSSLDMYVLGVNEFHALNEDYLKENMCIDIEMSQSVNVVR